jgi:hypothetical protein
LGGIEIPHYFGLLGHSDADVLTHAVMDALLGAAALGDIGAHFPDSDRSLEGISSLVLLGRVAELIGNAGWRVENIDATIVAQSPSWPLIFPRCAGRFPVASAYLPNVSASKPPPRRGLDLPEGRRPSRPTPFACSSLCSRMSCRQNKPFLMLAIRVCNAFQSAPLAHTLVREERFYQGLPRPVQSG